MVDSILFLEVRMSVSDSCFAVEFESFVGDERLMQVTLTRRLKRLTFSIEKCERRKIRHHGGNSTETICLDSCNFYFVVILIQLGLDLDKHYLLT